MKYKDLENRAEGKCPVRVLLPGDLIEFDDRELGRRTGIVFKVECDEDSKDQKAYIVCKPEPGETEIICTSIKNGYGVDKNKFVRTINWAEGLYIDDYCIDEADCDYKGKGKYIKLLKRIFDYCPFEEDSLPDLFEDWKEFEINFWVGDYLYLYYMSDYSMIRGLCLPGVSYWPATTTDLAGPCFTEYTDEDIKQHPRSYLNGLESNPAEPDAYSLYTSFDDIMNTDLDEWYAGYQIFEHGGVFLVCMDDKGSYVPYDVGKRNDFEVDLAIGHQGSEEFYIANSALGNSGLLAKEIVETYPKELRGYFAFPILTYRLESLIYSTNMDAFQRANCLFEPKRKYVSLSEIMEGTEEAKFLCDKLSVPILDEAKEKAKKQVILGINCDCGMSLYYGDYMYVDDLRVTSARPQIS